MVTFGEQDSLTSKAEVYSLSTRQKKLFSKGWGEARFCLLKPYRTHAMSKLYLGRLGQELLFPVTMDKADVQLFLAPIVHLLVYYSLAHEKLIDQRAT